MTPSPRYGAHGPHVDYYEPNATELENDLSDLRRRLLGAALFMLLVTLVGVVGFSVIDPGAGLVRAFFMTAITLTTVGYGEVIPLDSDGARIFTALLILVGMGAVLYFVSTATAFVLEGELGHVFRRRRMERDLADLNDHHIVCGSGATALYAAAELTAVERSVVLVAGSREGAEAAKAALPGLPVVLGDPTEDDILRTAGIQRARGLVACTESDNENVVVTLTARQLNPTIRIVTRIEDVDQTPKAHKVGANSAVSPQHIGGMRLASELIRPTVVGFLDAMLRDRELNLRVDEVTVPAGSSFEGRPIAELGLESLGDLLLMALRRDGKWTYNPPRAHALEAGTVLVLMGTPEDLRTLSRTIAA